MIEQGSSVVTKRQVFYLSGFDPRGAAFYHRLYQEESALQVKLLRANIEVSPRTRQSNLVNQWTVKADWSEPIATQTNTDYFFLNWDDIVRQYWEANLLKLAWISIPSYWQYMRCGAFSNIQKNHRGPFFSAIYPMLILFLLVLASAFLGLLVASFISQPVIAGAVGLAFTAACLNYGAKLINQWGVFWLLRTYLFVFRMGLDNSAMMLERLDDFVKFIKQTQLENPADEILLVGHSVGTIMAVHLAAMYAEQHPNLATKIKLITLGQCIPLLSGMPQATLFNQHFNQLQNQAESSWVDYVARADSLAFCDEQHLLKPEPRQPSIRVVRFFNMFEPKRYEQIKKNKLRLHFQYIMATEKLGDYDYFSITAGALPLQQ
jgi:Lipase (class 3)